MKIDNNTGSCRLLSVVTRHSRKQSSVDSDSDEISDAFTDKLEGTTSII